MVRGHPRAWSLVALTVATLLILLAALVARVGRPYPGFFVAPDFRVFPASPAPVAVEWGDRIVSVEGRSPVTLEARAASGGPPIRYEIERAGHRVALDLAPQPFTWRLLFGHFGVFFAVSAIMLAVGIAVFAQNPRARPNRNFLLYMCLWAVSNVAVPESVLGSGRFAAAVVGFVSIVLSVHGWVFFLTYPANPPREAWLERHRVIPRLYAAALVAGSLASVTFVALSTLAPDLLVDGWVYPASVATLFTLAAVSFPIKIAALLDTRRRAASPLVNQQTTVLLLGIGLGLGGWLAFMLAPLSHLYRGPVDPQWGSALVLLYPLAI
ncbi:MAG TPA: hypothetical protein VNS56_05540, partial [Methylomirabilota bacterium]|nr:hypothetical protein [Methylomirabilota bacterium]